jgi:sugar transferase (PEP-CTERM/EpsH1 system associated)
MKILFIAPRLPVPADTGGKIRAFNLVKQVAKRHRMDLVCFSFDAEDDRHAEQLRDLNIAVTLIPAREPGLWRKVGTVLLAPVPYSVAKYYSPAMDKAVEKLTRENAYDVVHCDHIHMTHYHKHFSRRPSLVDEHNVEYKILERCAGVEKAFIKKVLFGHQAGKMARFEARTIAAFSACTAVSDEDGRILKHLTKNVKPVYTLPNGVDTEFFQPPDRRAAGSPEEDAVVFTGSMDWLPNDDAAVYFCKDILPLIWNIKPDVKFYIVGKGPSDALKGLTQGEGRVVLTGRVEDVRVIVNKSKVFVVPLRIGGGTRLKILEAMSMGKAVVSTSIGAEGIAYSEDKNIVLADTPEVFAGKVLSLLDDEQRRASLGVSGRALVLKQYDWDIVGATLNQIYEDLKHAGPAPT